MIGLVIAAGALVALVRRFAGPLRRRVGLVREVAPDLRSPLLVVPTHLSSAERLAAARRLVVWPTRIAEGVTVTERSVPGPPGSPDVGVFVYEVPGRSMPSGALVWVHGGGMVMGSPVASHEWCSSVASQLGLLVVNVDYRLAPEFPFPAAVHDCVAVLSWLHAEAVGLGVDPDRVVVGGESAGGGLAASTCQVARHRGLPVARQVLVYPMLDDRTDGRGPDGQLDALLWSARANQFAWHAYHGGSPEPLATGEHPAPARTADVSGVAPAWIGVGDIDLFHDEDQAYAQRLRAAGVPCEVHVAPGLFHGSDGIVPKRPTSRAFRRAIIDAVADGACS